MQVSRRKFIQSTGLVTASWMVPGFLNNLYANKVLNNSGRKLLVIQLSGGNDFLNTLIPLQNDIYYKLRPKLSIPGAEALQLNDQAGFHPSLTGLKSFFDQGQVSILNSVGYPNPDRSHTRAMEIWQTASGSDRTLNTGWLGRYLDHTCQNDNCYTQALTADPIVETALRGDQNIAFSVNDPQKLADLAAQLESQNNTLSGNSDSSSIDYLYQVLARNGSSAREILAHWKTYSSTITYPDTAFGKGLKNLSALICSDLPSSVYYISLSGFDTHVAQKNAHSKLLQTLDQGLAAFWQDLKIHERQKEVVVMVFSEFGRRVKANGSGGTDHGTAGGVLLLGSNLKQAGLLNSLPDLSDLEGGDLKWQVDFRDIYACLLRDWLDCTPEVILGRTDEPLQIL